MIYDGSSFIGESFFFNGNTAKNIFYGQIKVFGKIIVALISTRHRHDSSCSIIRQNIVPNPNRNAFFRKRMQNIASCKYSSAIFDIGHTLALGSFLSFLNIFFHRFFLIGMGNFLNQIQLGCQGHESNSKQCIGACGKYLNPFFVIFYLKKYFCSNGLPNPITLHFF